MAHVVKSFYVTLDLSSATNQIRTRKSAQSTPTPTPTAEDAALPANDTGNGTDAPSITVQQEGETQDGSDVNMSNADDTEEPKDRIQILDLHSSNPIISYQNQIYSCEWTSTIGTDILLTIPDPDFPHPVLKEETGVSIIAATGIKLFGRPAQISSRPSASAENEPTQQATSAPKSSTAATSEAPPAEKTPSIRIPEGLLANKARENQAKFLERVIAIKAAKGEKDEVTVFTQKVNQRSGWRSQAKVVEERRASEAQDTESPLADGGGEAEDSVPTTPTAQRAKKSTKGCGRSVGRPRRGNWRNAGPRTRKGGLFRDYRPSLFDTAGADIRARPSATPESWDQLPIPVSLDDDAEVRQSSSTALADPINTPPPHPPQASSPKTAAVSNPPHSSPADRTQTPQTPCAVPGPAPTRPQAQASPPESSNEMNPACRVSATGTAVGGPSLGGGGERTSDLDLVGNEGRMSVHEVASAHEAGDVDDGSDDDGGDVIGGANGNENADVEMEGV